MGRLLMALTVVLLLLITVSAWALGPGLQHKFLPGVWVWDIALGGMTPEAATTHLQVSLPLQQPNLVIVGPEGQRWSLSPADLGMTVDTAATLTQAYAVGRQEAGLNGLQERLNVLLNGVTFSPVLAWNERLARERLQAIAVELALPAQDAAVRRVGAELQLAPGRVGRQMVVTATLEALLPHLYALEPAEIVPVFTALPPQINDTKVEHALALAHTMLAQPLTLLLADPGAGDPGPWVLPSDVLLEMLNVQIAAESVTVGLDQAALAQFLSPLALALFREPVDATFRFDATAIALTPISPSVTGRELDVAATILRINERLPNGEHFIPLVINTIPPARPDSITAADLGIREVVAVGESYFTGSSSARDKNIRLGASKFDGVIIAPGQTFSFNEYLGDVSVEQGYDESYVIINGRTVPGVGGGICQVATTAFRAAYYGGYPIVERWAHAYRVGYYELGGFGPGFDATVYSPLVDFRFKNDTPHHILIQTQVDAARARLRFLFYSTSDGRTVEQIGPESGKPEPPGAAIYEYDPTLPSGTLVKIENPHDGLLATLGRVVRDASGTIVYQDNFVSHFVPWPAQYKYGPNFIPPPDAIVVTPEP
ncbi:MAG TPA: VanW family protein [Anaerolineae bacterium]|nr:VanW family protein [Anaerolineae bacterium]